MVQAVLGLGTWKGTFQVRGSYLVQLSQFRELQCNLLIFVLLKKFGSPKYYENTVVLSCATPVNVGLISIRCVHFVWHCLVKIPMACGANSLAWSPLPPPLFSLSFTGLGCTTQSPLHYQSTRFLTGSILPSSNLLSLVPGKRESTLWGTQIQFYSATLLITPSNSCSQNYNKQTNDPTELGKKIPSFVIQHPFILA